MDGAAIVNVMTLSLIQIITLIVNVSEFQNAITLIDLHFFLMTSQIKVCITRHQYTRIEHIIFHKLSKRLRACLTLCFG